MKNSIKLTDNGDVYVTLNPALWYRHAKHNLGANVLLNVSVYAVVGVLAWLCVK